MAKLVIDVGLRASRGTQKHEGSFPQEALESAQKASAAVIARRLTTAVAIQKDPLTSLAHLSLHSI